MSPTRREFVHAAAGAAGAFGLAPRRFAIAGPRDEVAPARTALRILILGGTGFIGPCQVRYAAARGHAITLFNRGRTDPDLFPNVETLIGDRNDDLTALEGREWDAVIDNSATIPRWVRQSAELLRDAAGQYLYVSSISALVDTSVVGRDESAAVATLDDPTVEQVSGATYGGMKAAAEREAIAAFGPRATVVRPGLIVGPDDPTGRFTYWPVRIDRGGEVLAPGDPTDPVQFIDARDLSEWMVRCLEERHTGTFNATGPAARLSIAEMLYGIRAVTSTPLSFTWVDREFLAAQDVRPWQHLTVWIPPTDEMKGFHTIDCSRAVAHGLVFRPLADTARDTLVWFHGLAADDPARNARFGLPADRERDVLAAWHARG
jgi:2'-hydroxyisoflavone reductase